MKIFLAGATGAIGRVLLPLLVEAGHSVVGTTRSADKLASIAALGGEPVVADAFDREAVFAAVRAARPDVVMHQLTDLAGLDVASNSRLRIEGTRNLVDAAREIGVQRMIAQSLAAMVSAGSGLAHEDDPMDIDSPSRGAGAAAVKSLEDAVAEMPIGVALRYGILYGPGTWYSRDEWTSQRIRQSEIAANDAVTSFVHVADAAQAAFEALNWPAGIYNIVDDEPAPAREWVPLYAELIGATPPPITSGASPWERGASNAKAKGVGWRPRYPSWREGFKVVLGKDLK